MTNRSLLLHRSAELRYRVAIAVLLVALVLTASAYREALLFRRASDTRTDFATRQIRRQGDMNASEVNSLHRQVDALRAENDRLNAVLAGIRRGADRQVKIPGILETQADIRVPKNQSPDLRGLFSEQSAEKP